MRFIHLAILLTVFRSVATMAGTKTQIQYEKIPENLATEIDKFSCKGRFTKSGLLSDIGYSDADLAKGVPCRQGDFDNNGSVDYWVYKCVESLMACKSKVILMANKEILKAIRVSRDLASPDVFYVKKKKDHNYLERFGCHLPKVDSLIELGDGEGRENRIFSLNKDKGDFQEVSRCTTEESSDD